MSFSSSAGESGILERAVPLKEPEPTDPVRDPATPDPVKGHVLFEKCRCRLDHEANLK
jgi:hypothetical protein